jgi:uncharacterized membrane protein YgaE (UPF0421/DUF939 family)
MKIDSLKEKKSDFQELFKSLIYFEIIILSGIGTLTYKVLAKDVGVYMVLLIFIGLIISFLLSLYIFKVWNIMQELNKEIENA